MSIHDNTSSQYTNIHILMCVYTQTQRHTLVHTNKGIRCIDVHIHSSVYTHTHSHNVFSIIRLPTQCRQRGFGNGGVVHVQGSRKELECCTQYPGTGALWDNTAMSLKEDLPLF